MDTLTRIAAGLLLGVFVFTVAAPLVSPWDADHIDWGAI